MGLSQRFALACVLLSLAVLAPTRRDTADAMFPGLVLIRRPGTQVLTVLRHENVTYRMEGTVKIALLDKDPIAIVYSGLRPAPAPLDTANYYEVAEFWSSPNEHNGGSSLPGFSEAHNFSRIYLGGPDHPPVWKKPIVAPGGVRDTYYAIGQRADSVLRARGLKLR